MRKISGLLPLFCTVTEGWAGPENEARVPSTSVAVNCVYLFTAGTPQIIIATKILLVSFPDCKL